MVRGYQLLRKAESEVGGRVLWVLALPSFPNFMFILRISKQRLK